MNGIKEFLTPLTSGLLALASLLVAVLTAWKETKAFFFAVVTALKGIKAFLFSQEMEVLPVPPNTEKPRLIQGAVSIVCVVLFIVFAVFFFLPPPANTPPHISHIANQAVQAGETAGPIGFEVSDAETSAAALSVTAGSSNLALVPVSGISHGGTGEKRTISLTPVTGQNGTATISLTVTDAGGLTATDTFTLDVLPLTREELLALAWKAHNGEKWGQVAELTTKLLKDFEYPADKKQEEMTKLKAPATKTGRVGVDLSDADVRSNHSFGLINDVATALYLRGEAYMHIGKEIETRADWKKVMTFDHAVTFDVRTKEFWRTKEGAENRLFQLDRKK